VVTISLNNLGKKFGREWIFRKLSLEIKPGDKLVILGGNGSGKSTLLQVISGFVTPNEGVIDYSLSTASVASRASATRNAEPKTPDPELVEGTSDPGLVEGASDPELVEGEKNKTLDPDQLHRYISFASPYLQLVEDFTLTEMVEHASRFKPFMNQISSAQFIELIQLESSKDKTIKQFSSGMKQRLKLGLAILADTPLLLLDEPVSNLDKNAIQWYKNLVQNYGKYKTVIVCSNAIEEEYFFCDKSLNVSDYKNLKTTVA
jgi:ABC-type multidrug transport system ATPase subunit